MNLKRVIIVFHWILSFYNIQAQIQPDNIKIIRDEWGVPHIYGNTDAEAAYGLAWAHCEDDFPTIQYQLIRYRGRMGEYEGINGALSDFFFHYIKTKETVEKEYALLSQDYLAFLKGYVQGINDYASKHPKEILMKGLFPVNEKDILCGYVMTTAAMVGLPYALDYVLKGKADEYMFRPGSRAEHHINGKPIKGIESAYDQQNTMGSNAIAVHHSVSKDKKNHIVINPHIGLDDFIYWYEVHMVSNEGLNILGALFPGATSPGLGTTPQHAWAMTFNWPDYVDIYRMELNPKNKNQYLFDGQYYDFEKRKIPLKIKIAGIPITIKKTAYWCHYGPAYKIKDGRIYATRFAANITTKSGEQWYRMAKAHSFEEFKEALKMRNIPLFNIIYTDNQNIMYFFNAALPRRNPNYHWQKTLPGNTSETLWNEYLTYDELPKVINPACGFVYNTNNSPFYATCPPENCDKKQFDNLHAWDWNRQNNRALRLEELLAQHTTFDLDILKKIKYDDQYPLNGGVAKTHQHIFNLDPNKYPDIQDAIDLLKKWNYRTDTLNKVCPLLVVAFDYIFKQTNSGYVELETGISISEKLLVDAIRNAKKWLLKHYQKIDPEFGKVQRLRRKNSNLHFAISGMPEMLSPIASIVKKEGYLLPVNGDTYIQFATFGDKGLEKLETIVPMGASRRPNSPHYTDQMKLFAERKLKSMTLDWSELLKKSKNIYSPNQ